MIGRLKSGLYTLLSGHIYFNNNVIKLRYDLISLPNAHTFKENEVFDYYYEIFLLDPGERVKMGTPFNSERDHRMAFITSDRVNLKPAKVMYTPYLHEKKIYITRSKINTEYFYTSIST